MYIKLSAREMKKEFKLKYGGLAQLVEHLPCTQGNRLTNNIFYDIKATIGESLRGAKKCTF